MNITALKQHWDRVLALLAVLAGTVAVIAGWVGVSGAETTSDQLPYLASGAVGGIIAFGIASTLWISADLRDEWAKLDDIHRAVQAGAAHSDALPERRAPSGATGASAQLGDEVPPGPAQQPEPSGSRRR